MYGCSRRPGRETVVGCAGSAQQHVGRKGRLVIGKNAVIVDHDGRIETKWTDAVDDDILKTKSAAASRVGSVFRSLNRALW